MLVYLKKAIRAARSEGVRSVLVRFIQITNSRRRNREYREWVRKYDTFTDIDRRSIQDVIETLPIKPIISILMPVYDIDEDLLRRAIDSVVNQVYPSWELCIADDASTRSHIRRTLSEYAEKDPRIRVVFRETNGHISASSNSALELATGIYTALLDHDDELAPHALFCVAREINAFPLTDLVYSDEDIIDRRGRRYSPVFKPDWSPETFYSVNFINHLIVYRTELIRRVGGFRLGFEGSQDYDLALRVSEIVEPANVRHIPRILYHWRSLPGSVALDSSEKSYAHDRARKSITEHFNREGISVTVSRGFREWHRVSYALPAPAPSVSLIYSGTNQGRDTAAKILKRTEYPSMQVILAQDYASEGDHAHPSKNVTDFSSLNAAADHAAGDVLCFIAAETTFRNKDWLRKMVGLVMQEHIGVAGPRIVYPFGRIKSAGLILGIKGGVGRAHHGESKYGLGNFFRLQVTQNVSALPIDCLVIRKEVFDEVGGFDAGEFPHEYADVDLCLRLLDRNYRNVWTPWSELTQANERVFKKGPELDALKARWPGYFERDPYYNPNLSVEAEDLSFAFPPRIPRI